MKNLNWATPLGRNAKGQFVSLKKVKVAAAETPAPAKKVEFKSAIYGSGELSINIADRLTDKSIGRKVNNTMAGSDPAPKIKKELIVKAVIDGKEIEKTFKEGDKLEF